MIRHVLLSIFALTCCSLKANEANTLMQNGIEHVVVLMLENRSFDNVLAWLYSEEDPPNAFIPETTDPSYRGLSSDTLSLYTNVLKDSSGQVLFRTAPIKGIPSVADGPYLNSPQFDPNESFPNVLLQIYGDSVNNQPMMTGFLQNYASCWWEYNWQAQQKNISAIMETYTQNELPIIYGLAKHYAVSDDWFSSVPTDTNPNRAYAACGTSEGQIVNGPFDKSLFYSDTIWNRFTDLSPDTTWMIFWQSHMVPGLFPGPFTGPNTFAAMNRIPDLDSHYQIIDGFHELARNGQLPDFSFIEPQMTEMIELSSGSYHYTLGVEGNDMHPPGDIRTAENLVANIYTSLIANPEAWNKTLFVITFDEHGGLFDHVPPPVAIPPDSHFENDFTFNRYGVRVPAIFISPLIQKSSVVRSDNPTLPFDHTSIIATLLQWKNIDKSLWNMGQRAANAPTFDSCITSNVPRGDTIIASEDVKMKAPDPGNGVNIGDQFYLRDKEGNYLVSTSGFLLGGAYVGSADNKVALTFTCGSGAITHGSFAIIQSQDTSLGSANVLASSLLDADCVYEERSSISGQWWTIKSADMPYLATPIQFGDRIFLENHLYMNVFQFVPARLAKSDCQFVCQDLLTCKPITDESSDDNYWIIEKALPGFVRLKDL